MTTPEQAYNEAADLYNAHRYDEAATVLQRLVTDHPENVEYHHALAICQVNIGQYDAAIINLRGVLAADAGRADDAYTLGCLLQHQGEYHEAEEAFRAVAAVSPSYRDVQQRLAQCAARDGAAVAVPTVVLADLPRVITANGRALPQGLLSARRIVDDYGSGDVGELVQACRQQVRYHLPAMARSITVPVLITLLLVSLPTIVRLLPSAISQPLALPPSGVHLLHVLAELLLVVCCLRAAGTVGWLTIEARCYKINIYQRGVDVSSGVFRRQKRFIWFYQLTEEPQYLQTFATVVCHTASLALHYNDASSTTQDTTLEGIGSPAEVEGLRGYIKFRRLAERGPMKGILT